MYPFVQFVLEVSELMYRNLLQGKKAARVTGSGKKGRVSSRLNRIAVIYLPHGLMIVEGCHGLLFLDKSSA